MRRVPDATPGVHPAPDATPHDARRRRDLRTPLDVRSAPVHPLTVRAPRRGVRRVWRSRRRRGRATDTPPNGDDGALRFPPCAPRSAVQGSGTLHHSKHKTSVRPFVLRVVRFHRFISPISGVHRVQKPLTTNHLITTSAVRPTLPHYTTLQLTAAAVS